MQNIKVTLIQTELFWEDIDANLSLLESKIKAIGDTDLIVLPEMFTTGFSMNAAPLAQDMRGSGVKWLKRISSEKGADLVGSLIIQEDGHYYNRLCWAKPDKSLAIYDKRHLFRMAGEHKIYHAGDKLLTVSLKGWKIRPFICYDLRFPGWSRNIDNSYDMSLYIANWPAARSMHWRALITARAIENQCFVIGLNRIGTDGNGVAYRGESTVVDPLGEVLFHEHARISSIHTLELDYKQLAHCRNTFQVWQDTDNRLFNFPKNQEKE